MAGIIKSSLPNGRNLPADAALQTAAELGVDGLLFNSLFDISQTLDPTELAKARVQANRLQLRISSMLGFINPALPIRGQSIVEAGSGDMQTGIERLVRLAASIGIHDMFFIIGTIEDRFDIEVSWQTQLDGVADMLSRCATVLRECGSKLLLKTHEEITTSEVVDIVERVGADVVGVAFDPVNVLCRLEDPVAAARRVAPYAEHIYVDDAVVCFQANGIRRFLAPMGEGFVDWEAIGSILRGRATWIEMHAGQFSMPIFDKEWLRRQPAVAIEEFSAVLAMAVKFGSRKVPWDQADPGSRLERALERLRGLPR